MCRRFLAQPLRAVAATLLAAALGHTTTTTNAQPLLEHVPADAVAYFGWAGTDTLADAYAQSTLREVIDLIETQKLQAAWRSAMPTLRQEINYPAFQAQLKHLTELWGVSVRGQWAVYATLPKTNPALPNIDTTDADEFDALPDDFPLPLDPRQRPNVVLLWQPVTGDDRKDLLEGLKFYQSQSTRQSELVIDGEIVSLHINPPAVDLDAVLDPQAPASLAEVPRFAEALAQLDTPGPLVGYVDLNAIVAQTRHALTQDITVHEHDAANPHAPAGHPALALFEPLGLDTLGSAVLTAGYDGKRWRSQVHLAVPAPRTGLAALLDAPALTADDLGRAPIDSPWLTAVSFDPGRLMDLLRNAATAMGPDAADQFEQGLATASGLVGIDVENQLIRGLGPAWSFYLDPDAAGPSMLGLTAINPLLDPQGVERGLRSIQMFGNLALMQQMDDENFKVQVHTQTYQGIDLHTLGTPLLSPTWAVVNGQLVAGLTPQTVLAAIDRLDQPGSITQQDDFAALRETIGTRRLTALSWIDLRRNAPTSYPNLLLVESLLTGSASMLTGQPMPMVLPPLGRLKPMLEPAHSIAWIDDAGWHYDSHSPFPGATLLSPQSSSLGATAGVLPMLGAATFRSTQEVYIEPPPQP
ncbi:MAG: hypothetical protein AAF086_01360 [Planctomycetota bacterium]